MKLTIRKGIFETNSSSTHVCIICKNEDEYQNFIKGNYYYNGKSIYPLEELEVDGIKYTDLIKDFKEIDNKEFYEKYKDFFYEEEDAESEESIQEFLSYSYGIYFYDYLWKEYEENITERDEITVICFSGYDG